MEEPKYDGHFFLTVNGQKHKVDSTLPPWTHLLQFLREKLSLKGTKGLCYYGGCGVCTVVLSRYDPETNTTKTFSAPSCRIPVYSCVGASIETIEYLGSKKKGFHVLQKALAGFCGTQCGFCSPGMIMTAHGKGVSSGSVRADKIEKSLDGNICRCTGYRPILDAFKSFATDAHPELKQKLADIEDLNNGKCNKSCQNKAANCSDCKTKFQDSNIKICHQGTWWYRPTNIDEMFSIIRKAGTRWRFIAGNASPYAHEFSTLISTNGMKELFEVHTSKTQCSIGANITIGRCIEIFEDLAEENQGYKHLKPLAEHWSKVANTGVRNIATWAGNLILKNIEPSFASDIWLTLVCCDARIRFTNGSSYSEIDLLKFLKTDMSGNLIVNLILPPKYNFKLKTYKVMPRATNTAAYINAAIGFQTDKDGLVLTSKPTILFGGLHSSKQTSETGEMLRGVELTKHDKILEAICHLSTELKATESDVLDTPAKYRVTLCQSVLYKAFLDLIGERGHSRVQSGGDDLQRPLSSGKQTYDENKDSWPIGQPIPKVETSVQVTGEAEYTDDLPPAPGELFGIFVQSTCARAKIKSIDATECLEQPGVVDFITAENIPGKNSFVNEGQIVPIPHDDPIFASSDVIYGGQPIGLVVAKTKHDGMMALPYVKVTYEDIQEPVVSIKDAIDSGRAMPSATGHAFSPEPIVIGYPEETFSSSNHTIEGEMNFGSQFHFPMEPLAARVVPTEEGFDVSCTTQWPTEAQKCIAACLNVPNNSINLSVKRLGGGFGGKITRGHGVPCAAAVAANKLNKPVRVTLDLSTYMSLAGCREPYYIKYKVAFTDEGRLTTVIADIVIDVGHTDNESSGLFSFKSLQNVYHSPNWKVTVKNAFTDSAANTFCRAPGYVETLAGIENILEHIAHYLKKDPLEIRWVNFVREDSPPTLFPLHQTNLVESKIFPLMQKDTEFAKRMDEIKDFNKKNRWVKRGLSLVPTQYEIHYFPVARFNIQVVIYENDGTVAITHSGIEMGQGINTKVVQAAANVLKIPLDLIQVKATNIFTGANSGATEASLTSDLNVKGVMTCCQVIKKRMEPLALKMQEESGGQLPSWVDLVRRCRSEQIDICERLFILPKDYPTGYDVWAGACVEVILDVLTGQHIVMRVDIMEDCGRSLNPCIDVGQVEGAFVMGQGFFTTESLKFNPTTGLKASIGNAYHPPTALDVPVDFRVSFLPGGDNLNGGVLRSKATGEPAICLSYGIVTALRQAIHSARNDAGNFDWFEMDIPVRPEDVFQLCLVDAKDFRF